MEVSRRGYYSWLNRPPSPRTLANEALLRVIKRLFYANREVYGAPRIYHCLREEGYDCSLNRVAKLMREAQLVPKTIKHFRVTTDSRKSRYPSQNVLKRQFTAAQPNVKWVSDVTYIPTREGWVFLAVVLDLYSRRIVGWAMDNRLTSELAQRALLNALEDREPPSGLIAHSDQGKEYYAGAYQAILQAHGLISSMSRKGDCYDNAVAESFFHSLKVELVHHADYRTRQQARSAIFDYIEIFYNRQRKHSYLDYRSPVEFEECNVA